MALIRTPAASQLTENAVTDERLFRKRRQFIKSGLATGIGVSLGAYFPALALASVQGLSEKIGRGELV